MASPAAAATPDTKITSGPSGLIASRSVTFKFSANVAGATFRCSLDGATWSVCTSPKGYSGLAQGKHTFRVRAIKNGVSDPTPAFRAFTVDTISPNTTILSGPTGITGNHSPTFTFSSSEPGSFECKLTTLAFKPCTSPFTPASPLPDGSYTFRVRAKDKAGNVDGTPASRAFSVETPLTNDLQTAEAAAQIYFPDAASFDAPAQCAGTVLVDCPGGTPLPPADQLTVTSSRSVVGPIGGNRYDVTATENVATLQPIKLSAFGADCDLNMNSANGATPTWTVTLSLDFVVDAESGALRIEHSNTAVSGFEDSDWSLSGSSLLCSLAGTFTTGTVRDAFVGMLEAYFDEVGWSLCAAPGPAYLGPCPTP